MLRMIDVDIPMARPDFETARHLALEIAHANEMDDPMIVSWCAHDGHRMMSPSFEGGRESWWEKYGIGNYGEMKISVAHTYDFVLTDSEGCETLDEMPLRDVYDQEGNAYTCYASMLGTASAPDVRACFRQDEWLAKQT